MDSAHQHAATIERLRLPFPLLSDPDRSAVIGPYGMADEQDRRNIARPGAIAITPSGHEAFRVVARDYADRIPEDELITTLRGLNLAPTTSDEPRIGFAKPGPHAMPFEQLHPYFRGARFAVVAISRRHPEIADDARDYIDEMDRYIESVKRLYREMRD